MNDASLSTDFDSRSVTLQPDSRSSSPSNELPTRVPDFEEFLLLYPEDESDLFLPEGHFLLEEGQTRDLIERFKFLPSILNKSHDGVGLDIASYKQRLSDDWGGRMRHLIFWLEGEMPEHENENPLFETYTTKRTLRSLNNMKYLLYLAHSLPINRVESNRLQTEAKSVLLWYNKLAYTAARKVIRLIEKVYHARPATIKEIYHMFWHPQVPKQLNLREPMVLHYLWRKFSDLSTLADSSKLPSCQDLFTYWNDCFLRELLTVPMYRWKEFIEENPKANVITSRTSEYGAYGLSSREPSWITHGKSQGVLSFLDELHSRLERNTLESNLRIVNGIARQIGVEELLIEQGALVRSSYRTEPGWIQDQNERQSERSQSETTWHLCPEEQSTPRNNLDNASNHTLVETRKSRKRARISDSTTDFSLIADSTSAFVSEMELSDKTDEEKTKLLISNSLRMCKDKILTSVLSKSTAKQPVTDDCRCSALVTDKGGMLWRLKHTKKKVEGGRDPAKDRLQIHDQLVRLETMNQTSCLCRRHAEEICDIVASLYQQKDNISNSL